MKVMVLGASGYAAGPLVRALRGAGHEVCGLARSAKSAAALAAQNVEVIEGDAREPSGWMRSISDVDAMITLLTVADFGAEGEMMRALVEGFREEDRTFIFTCGTAVLSIEAHEGRWNEATFAEDDPFPFPELAIRRLRLPTENMVREAGTGGYRTMVVRPPLIYGNGGSNQVPGFFDSALEHGFVSYVGMGLNLYSNVHVEDLAVLYPLALDRGQGGALYHAVGGEANFREIAEAAGQVLNMPVRSLSLQDACKVRHPARVRLGIAVNSRSRSPRARSELGWEPKRVDMIDDIRNGSYREAYGHLRRLG